MDSVYLKSSVSVLTLGGMCMFIIVFFQFENSAGVLMTKLVTLPWCWEGLQGCTGAGCV